MIYVVQTKATEKYQNMPIMISEATGESIEYVDEDKLPDGGKIWHYFFLDRISTIKPNTDIAKKWDNKIFQYDQFRDKLKIPRYDIYNNSIQAISNLSKLKKKYKSFMITKEYGFYGTEYMYCDESTEAEDIFNKYGYVDKLRVSEFINDAVSISLHMIIANIDEFYLSPITKQHIENVTLYRGGKYPCISRDRVYEQCVIINNALFSDGYVGMAHIDFLMTDDIYFGEINPRVAGSTPYMCYSLENECNINLPYLEYYAVLNQSLPDINTIKQRDVEWDFRIKEGEVPENNISHMGIRQAFKASGKYYIPFGENKYIKLVVKNDKRNNL